LGGIIIGGMDLLVNGKKFFSNDFSPGVPKGCWGEGVREEQRKLMPKAM